MTKCKYCEYRYETKLDLTIHNIIFYDIHELEKKIDLINGLTVYV